MEWGSYSLTSVTPCESPWPTEDGSYREKLLLEGVHTSYLDNLLLTHLHLLFRSLPRIPRPTQPYGDPSPQFRTQFACLHISSVFPVSFLWFLAALYNNSLFRPQNLWAEPYLTRCREQKVQTHCCVSYLRLNLVRKSICKVTFRVVSKVEGYVLRVLGF